MIFKALIFSSLLIAIYMIIIYCISLIRKDNSVVDVAWGAGFILIALYTLFRMGLFLPRQLLITTLVVIWGIRICLHILLRNWGRSEDLRYKALRQTWGSSTALRSFFQIYLLQGFSLLIIAYPIMLVNSTVSRPLGITDALGTLMWLMGWLFETIGDYQLLCFIKNPANRGTIMMHGLWRYSRHPNYFGEAMLWWGIFIIACAAPHGWTALISPTYITILLLFVSGIPVAEATFRGNADYKAYQQRTSAFIPWWPKK